MNEVTGDLKGEMEEVTADRLVKYARRCRWPERLTGLVGSRLLEPC